MDKQEVTKFFDSFMSDGDIKYQVDTMMKSQGTELSDELKAKMMVATNVFFKKMRSTIVDSFVLRFSDGEFNKIKAFFSSVSGSKFHSFQQGEMSKLMTNKDGLYIQFVQEMIVMMMEEVLGEDADLGEFSADLSNLKNELHDKLGISEALDNDEDDYYEEDEYDEDGDEGV